MILSFIIAGVSFLIGGYLLKGVSLKSIPQAFIVAIVVAILDVTLGTVLKIATLGILSLWIFNWFLNALLIQVADWFLPKFKVKNFWWALALAAIVSISSALLDSVFGVSRG